MGGVSKSCTYLSALARYRGLCGLSRAFVGLGVEPVLGMLVSDRGIETVEEQEL